MTNPPAKGSVWADRHDGTRVRVLRADANGVSYEAIGDPSPGRVGRWSISRKGWGMHFRFIADDERIAALDAASSFWRAPLTRTAEQAQRDRDQINDAAEAPYKGRRV